MISFLCTRGERKKDFNEFSLGEGGKSMGKNARWAGGKGGKKKKKGGKAGLALEDRREKKAVALRGWEIEIGRKKKKV